MNTTEPSPDFRLQLWSSLVLLRPLTPSAERWLDEHLAHNDEVRWFDRVRKATPMYACEPLPALSEGGTARLIS